MTERPAAGDQFVQSLARGLDVIAAFGAERPQMTLTEVAAATDLSRAAARRFLLTLAELGYVRSNGKSFALTPQVLQLGTAYLSGLGLPELARPHLEDLSARTEESSSVAVLDGADIVYVARVAVHRIMTVNITVGTRFPAHATSMGRVLLAGLDLEALNVWLTQNDLVATTDRTVTDEAELRDQLAVIRDQGWAASDQELAPGLRSVAAPVEGPTGDVVAAVNVSSTIAHEPVDEYLTHVLDAASAISRDLAIVS